MQSYRWCWCLSGYEYPRRRWSQCRRAHPTRIESSFVIRLSIQPAFLLLPYFFLTSSPEAYNTHTAAHRVTPHNGPSIYRDSVSPFLQRSKPRRQCVEVVQGARCRCRWRRWWNLLRRIRFRFSRLLLLVGVLLVGFCWHLREFWRTHPSTPRLRRDSI